MAHAHVQLNNEQIALVGSDIYLRDFVLSDWPAVQVYAADEQVVHYMSWGPNTPEQTIAFLENAVATASHRPRTRFDLAVVRGCDNLLVGGAGIYIKPGRSFEAEIGYCLRPAVWGQGYGTQVARLLVSFGFAHLRLHRIFATCDPENRASARVLEKAGMQREGLMRSHMLTRAGWRDSYLFAIVEGDPLPV